MLLLQEKIWRFRKNKKQQVKKCGAGEKHDIFFAG
jgi:hypothetical protein